MIIGYNNIEDDKAITSMDVVIYLMQKWKWNTCMITGLKC